MKTKYKLSEMRGLSDLLAHELSPFCERLKVAGSIRRGTETVGDIELVAIPKFGNIVTPDLFGDGRVSKQNLLWTHLDAMEAAEEITYKKRGDKYRQFHWGVPQVDLFTAQVGNWGWIYLIRTGSADFSHRMAKALNRAGYTSKAGWITPIDSPGEGVETVSEDEVFELAGLPFVEPHRR